MLTREAEANRPDCSEDLCVCAVPEKRKVVFRRVKEAVRFAVLASLFHCIEARENGSGKTACKASLVKTGFGGIPKPVSRREREKFDKASTRYAGEFMRFAPDASAGAERRHPAAPRPEATIH